MKRFIKKSFNSFLLHFKSVAIVQTEPSAHKVNEKSLLLLSSPAPGKHKFSKSFLKASPAHSFDIFLKKKIVKRKIHMATKKKTQKKKRKKLQTNKRKHQLEERKDEKVSF